MTMPQQDIKDIQRILDGQETHFNANLLRLMAQADNDNLQRLASAFPETFIYYMEFKYGGVPSRFVRIPEVFEWMDEMRRVGAGPDWINSNGYHSRYLTLGDFK